MLIIDKTNQEGKAQYGVAFRNKEVQYCPVGGVALWIFYRYHVMNELGPTSCTQMYGITQSSSQKSRANRMKNYRHIHIEKLVTLHMPKLSVNISMGHTKVGERDANVQTCWMCRMHR